jgi:aminobenzoyl-glutamate transport protein
MLIALLNTALKNVPATLVPYVIAFVGTVGNIASDTAMVVIPPLAALVYMGVGKHPVIGMMVGYAGAQAGFTANLMIAGTDTLLQGLTNDAILSFLPDTTFAVDAACNWYFMIASTFLCSLVIGTVSIKLIEPRFGKYEGSADSKIDEVTADQKKGLRAAGITAVVYIALVAALYYGGPLKGMFLKGMIPILFCLFSLCGLAFGYTSKAYKNVVDVNKAMTRQMSAMGSYILFCFFCGQFQGLFNWTKLGTMLAIAGADFFESIGFTGIPLCVAFIVLCAFVNIFISSGSAKWAIFAPIFVPMFMLLGYTPAFAQYIYRLGDSAGNMFGPTGATLWMLLSMAQEKYDKNLTIGKFLSCNMTTALILEAFWIVFLVIWMLAGIPVGPGEGIWLATPIA